MKSSMVVNSSNGSINTGVNRDEIIRNIDNLRLAFELRCNDERPPSFLPRLPQEFSTLFHDFNPAEFSSAFHLMLRLFSVCVEKH